MKKILAILLVAVLVFGLVACGNDPAPVETPEPTETPEVQETPDVEEPSDIDFPTRDISAIVPWGAGGGTDLTVRNLLVDMEAELGVNVPVLNTPGASGSVGMQEAFGAALDGYTILGTSMSSLATVRVMGLAEIGHDEWYAWNAAFTPNVIAVPADSPFETLEELVEAMIASPDTITVGTAGVGSSGHLGAVVFAQGVDATFSHIPYEGGNPAIIATLGGEVDITTQLLSETIDHIRSGDLRALAQLGTEDMEVIGTDGEVIVIPTILNYFPGMASELPMGGSFGIMVPREMPAEIVAIINAAYEVAVAGESFRNFTEESGMIAVGMSIEETDAYLASAASKITWILYDFGIAVHSPADFGIPR